MDAPACTPSAETCNDLDDDCDGMTDEDLAVVGAAVVFDSSTISYAPHLVGVRSGFVVIWVGASAYEQWRNLDPLGGPLGPLRDLDFPGTRAQIAFDGTRILVAAGTLHAYQVSDASPLWASAAQRAWALADPTPTRVTAYVRAPSTTTRYRFDTTTFPDATVVNAVDAGSCAWDATNTSALRAGSDEYFACGDSTGAIVLRRGTSGDGTTISDVGPLAPAPTASSNPWVNIAMAVRDVTAPVGAANPLGVVWMQGDPNPGANTTFFAQISSLAPLMVAATALPASLGIPDFGGYYHGESFVGIAPVPGDASAGHWYVVATEPPDAGSTFNHGALRVWEISRTHPAGRALAVPGGGSAPLTDVVIAASDASVRVAASSPTGLSTRSIGCH